MRIFRTELKKLLSGRIFLLITAVAIVLNAYLMLRTANSSGITPSDYKAVYTELESKNDEEKLEWLNARCNEFSGQHHYSLGALYELRDECDMIVNYHEYLANIDAQAESMSSISIFAKPDTFNYRSIMKTPPAYENMSSVKPVFSISKGIILATHNNFTDILIGFIVLFAVLSLMLSDREQGLSGLLFPLRRGRGYLLLTKLGVLAVTVSAVILIMYAENLIIGGYIYGLGDLSRPVQSLNGFIGCNLRISVLGYLFLYILFKAAAVFTAGAVLSLIAVNTRSSIAFYGVSAAVFITEGILYAKIHPLSIYSIFRYINLIAFTRGNDVFCNFKNINFWEYPIPLIPASAGAVFVISLLCITAAILINSKKRNLEYKKLGFRFDFLKSEKPHKPLYYTLSKSLTMQKGLAAIAIFIAVSGFMSTAFVKKYDPADTYYRYYCNQLEGDITQETLDFVEAETLRFEKINTRIEELSQTHSFSAELNQLSREIAPSIGFYPVAERITQLRGSENAQIFYDSGYKRAFGKSEYNDDMKYALAMILLSVFLVSPLIANDNRYRMSSIINSTKSGRFDYIRRNILTASLYGVIAALLWILPYAFTINRYYGCSGLSASLDSITDFSNFPLKLTVLQYILIICLLRIAASVIAALVMLKISSMCKNPTSAILINFAVFALPVIICLLGADFMVNIGFNPILSVNAVLNNPSPVHLIPVLIIIIIMRPFSLLKEKLNSR